MNKREQMVADAERVKDTEEELTGLIPVKARVAKERKTVRSVRMSPSEYKVIWEAAQAKGLETGEFIRTAALAAARGELNIDITQLGKTWVVAMASIQAFQEEMTQLGVTPEEPSGDELLKTNLPSEPKPIEGKVSRPILGDPRTGSFTPAASKDTSEPRAPRMAAGPRRRRSNEEHLP